MTRGLVGGLVVATALAAVTSWYARASDPNAASSSANATVMVSTGAEADSVRDEFARAIRDAAFAEDTGPASRRLGLARELAASYASAWGDSFLIRRLAAFEAASPAHRRDIAMADSLWRAGRKALGREGAPRAMGLWREGLARASAASDSAGRANALHAIGVGFYLTGALDSAEAYLAQALDLATTVGDFRTRGNALGNLANVAKDRGDLAAAVDFYREAAKVRVRSGDTRGQAADENNLGLVAWALGDLQEARIAFERALALNRVAGRERFAARNLDNLGDLASLAGEYAEAESAYLEAVELNRAAGDDAEMAFVLHDLGRLAARRADYPTALTTLSRALELHEQSEAVQEAVIVRSDLAGVEAAVGDFEAALSTLREAEQGTADMGSAVRARLALAEADLAVQIGRFAEADARFERAERAFTEAENQAGRAEAQQGRGRMELLRGNHDGALRWLSLASRGQRSAGDLRSAALTRLLLGTALGRMGDTAAARDTLLAARTTLGDLGDTAGEVAAMLVLADLEVANAAPLAAEALYERALENIADLPLWDLRWRVHHGWAASLRSRGATRAAEEQLRMAVAVVEEVAGALRDPERRTEFLSEKWSVYEDLALVEHRRNLPGESFAVSERMRARQLLAMLTGGRIRYGSVLGGKEQDLRRRISELTADLAAAEPAAGALREPTPAEQDIDVLREALDDAQKAYSETLRGLRDSHPGYAGMVAAETADWRDVSDRLPQDAVLLEYMLTESTSVVYIVTSDTVDALDLNVTRGELARLVDFARSTMDLPDRSLTAPLWKAPLRKLYTHLIQPVEQEGHLDGRRALLIVPHVELNFLPFGALLSPQSDELYMVERFHLAYAPSATAWVRLAERSASRRSSDVLALAPFPDRLPASTEEVEGIEETLGSRARVVTGAAASESLVLDSARNYGVLHLATFGVLNKHNPLFSYVELAPRDDADGRLEVHEVFDLALDGQLVVLSACQTGLASGTLADVPAGEDWVGLVQAFMQAGASSVLASLWTVEDRATAGLMKHFYRRLAAGDTEPEALAAAQRTVLRQQGTEHPFFWAGFVFAGAVMSGTR